MSKTFPLERGECITMKVMVLSSLTKFHFDSQPLICFNKWLYNLDLFFHVGAKEILCVCKARKVNADRLVELKGTQG